MRVEDHLSRQEHLLTNDPNSTTHLSMPQLSAGAALLPCITALSFRSKFVCFEIGLPHEQTEAAVRLSTDYHRFWRRP